MSCGLLHTFFVFKQKTSYEVRMSDWSSGVCASDLFEMAAQQARIKESLKVLNDDDLAELVAKMRNVDDVSRIGEVLTDAAQAEAFSAWRRVTNSISLMLRSNPLTLTTMAVNSISGVGHDFFKGPMGRLWAAHRLQHATRPVAAIENGRSA